jgi:pimeloyl-ACP methyl ester carboxylesterase
MRPIPSTRHKAPFAEHQVAVAHHRLSSIRFSILAVLLLLLAVAAGLAVIQAWPRPAATGQAAPGAALGSLPVSSTPSPPSVAGTWVGGFALGGGGTTEGHIRVTFAVSPTGLLGEVELPVANLDSQAWTLAGVQVEGARVRFQWVRNAGTALFDGALSGDGITGQVTQGGQHGSFQLARQAQMDDSHYARYSGTYRFPSGKTIGLYSITHTPTKAFPTRMMYVDLQTGDLGALFPVSDTAFMVGPAIGLAYPFQAEVTFPGGAYDAAPSLTWATSGGGSAGPEVASRVPLGVEEVRYKSDDITLAGRLVLPPASSGPGPYPAVVIAPAAGQVHRQNLTFDTISFLLAMHGIATLSYDKRGVGDSGGIYTGDRATEGQIDIQARDALAGVAYLKTRPEIDPRQIGMQGNSQAGWTIPTAASRSADLAFMILWSGPGVTQGISDYFSRISTSGLSPDEIAARLRDTAPSGIDPIPQLARLTVPGLWCFGADDKTVPVPESAANREKVKGAGGKDYTIKIFPNAGHPLFESPTGRNEDLASSQRFVPGLLTTTLGWLLDHITIATPGRVRALLVPGPGSQTFPETGKTVQGVFLQYWQAHGGLAQQGFPISDVLTETSDLNGKQYEVQYFERSVFEYHPENQTPYDVLLSQLGTFQYKQKYPNGAASQQPATGQGSVLFPETGKHVGGLFLKYWQAHGGLAQQGFPISEEFQERSDLDGKTYKVQYFERAVFEYHPENQAPYDVLLSQLGTFRYRARYAGQVGPPAEGLVDSGGYKLYYACSGQGSPVVVMDAGLATTSSTWSTVQPEVAKFTRACVYDRANLGRSDRGPSPRTSMQIAKELRTLLTNAGIGGPYVAVGHSQGGLNMLMFAELYRKDIAGIVSVDGAPPDIDARFEAILTPEQVKQRQDLIGQNREGVTYDDTHISGQQVQAAAPLPDVPFIILRHGIDLQHPAGWPVADAERIWREAQEALAANTHQGKVVVAEGSGHFIQVDKPQLVIDTIHDIVNKARGK